MVPAKKNSGDWLPTVFNDFFGNEWLKKSSANTPAVNIKETPTEFMVEVAAPGLTKEDFKITINEDHQLIVTVQKDESKEDNDDDGKFLRREFAYTQFQQTMILPENVETDKIDAQVKNGVLSITIPKVENKQTAEKTIAVK